MFKVLVFDFDGTIVDSMDHLADIAAEQMNEHYGLSFEMGRHLYFLTSGIPFEQQMELIFPKKEANKTIVSNFEDIKEAGVLDDPLFPEVKEVFKELKKSGYKIATSSSNFQNLVEKYLDLKNIKVDLPLGYKEGFEKGKDHFNCIKKHFAVNSNEILFIGDSLMDYERAINNSIEFVGRSSTFTTKELKNKGVKQVINNLNDLLKIL